MHTSHSKVLAKLSQKCNTSLGVTYNILLQQHFIDYEKAIALSEYKNSAQIAFLIVEELFKQQKYELHEELCLFFIQHLVPADNPCLDIAQIYRQLALNYDIHERHSEADKIYTKVFHCLELIENVDNNEKWKLYASLWYNRSGSHRKNESKEKLAIYTRNALHFFEYLNDINGMSLCLNRLALLLAEDEYTQKFALLRRIISLNNGANRNQKNIAMAQFNIGYFKFLSGEDKLGIAYMKEAIDLLKAHTNSRNVGLAYLQMATAFFKREQYDSAKENCKLALDIFYNLKVTKHISEAENLMQKIKLAE
ncbi:MAG TPA: hypothetical protein PL084_07210 [Chitinophagales bacterium]|nr:hypothetical protein [Chitinophagales bacterium]